MKTVAILLLITLSASFELQRQIFSNDKVSAIPWPYTTCGQGDWSIDALTLDSAPKRNTNDNIVVTGTANDAIDFNGVILNVKVNGVFLDKQNIDFTQSYDSGDSVEFTYKNYIPSFAPSGTYTLTFEFQDSNSKANGCLQFQFKL